MVDWDWESGPTYASERIRIDGRHSPVVFYDMKLPRLIEDHEVERMLQVADHHLDRDLPFVLLIRQIAGTGVISGRHRQIFAHWLETRAERLKDAKFSIVIVMPEAIYRAVLRVVYRFRTPPIRTITTRDLPSAIDAVRDELERLGHPATGEIDAFLESLPG